MSSFTPNVAMHSVPEHERTVVPDHTHPLADPAVLAGSRDPLTGCLDRSHLDQLADRLAGHDQATLGAIAVRVEGEGSAGDDRDVPDAVLWNALRAQTARFLMRHVRGSEPLIRSGENDFLIIVPGAEPRDTDRLARRVQLHAFNKAPAALSLGWASRTDGESLDALVGRADAARRNVPQGGRGEERRRGS